VVANIRTGQGYRFTRTGEINTGCYGSLTHHRRSVNVRELNEIYASGTVFYPLFA
jgi:hypothetical protein